MGRLKRQKTVYYKCHIIHGSANRDIIEDGAIVVDHNGMLAYVGKESDMGHVSGAEQVDLKGAYVMPGLINAHGHFFNSGDPMNNFPEFLVDLATWFLKTWVGRIYLKFEYRQNYNTSLNAGITTVRDAGSLYFNDIKFRKYFKKKRKKRPNKKQIGPGIIACGRMLTTTGGHGYLYPDRGVEDNPWAMRKLVRENIMEQPDWIKICNTEGVSDAEFIGEAGKVSMTIEEIVAACEEAHSRNKLVATHCESTEGIRRALLGGVDTIEHGAAIPDELIPLFLNNPKSLRGYTALIPTLSAFFIPDLDKKLKPTEENHIIVENTKLIGEGAKEGFLKALENGVKIGVGNDASVPRVTHYDLYKELLYMQSFSGLPNDQLIQMATIDNAKILNRAMLTGSLEAGKMADFIVLDHNPLEDLNHLYKPKEVVVQGFRLSHPKFKVFKHI